MYLKILGFLFFFCLVDGFVVCHAQDLSAIDSLKKELTVAKGPGIVSLYYNLAFEYVIADDLSAALVNLELAKSGALAFGDSLYLVKSGRLAGQVFRRQNELMKSIHASRSVVAVAQRNSHKLEFREELKYLYNSLGLAYTFLAKYDSALDSHYKCLLLREESGSNYDVSETLNNIGFLYFKLKSYPKALEFYERSLRQLERSEDQSFKDRLLINIGICQNQMKQYELAKSYIKDGLAFCNTDCNAQILIEGSFGLGFSYFQTSEFATARTHFLKSYELAKSESNPRFQLENLVYLIRIENQLRNLAQAGDYLAEAEAISVGSEYVILRQEVLKEYAIYYNQKGDFESASKYQKLYIESTEKVFNEKLIEAVSKIETDFDQRENMRTIREKELALDQSRKLNFAIAGLFLLAGALAVVMFRSNRIVRRVNVALSEARNQLEIQNKELDKLVEARTEELNRSNASLRKAMAELDHFIYKTSHDILGPLATLKGITGLALMDVKEPIARDYFQKLDITAAKLNSVLTRLMIVNQINNALLVPVKVNVSQIIESVLVLQRKEVIPARMNVSTFVPPDVEVNSEPQLLSIVLENLIGNAIKYYNQSERVDPFVKITAVVINGQLLVEVLDNGIGISEEMKHEVFKMFTRASERSDTGGVGLYLSQQAADKLGGSISFETTPEKYTRFTAVIPADLQKVIDSRQGGKPAGAAPAKLLKTSPDASRKAS